METRSGAIAIMSGVTPHLNLNTVSRICVIIKSTLAVTTNKPPNFSGLSIMKSYFLFTSQSHVVHSGGLEGFHPCGSATAQILSFL